MGVKATEKRTPRQMFLLDRARKRSSRFASLDPHVVTTIGGRARLRGARQRRLTLGELCK